MKLINQIFICTILLIGFNLNSYTADYTIIMKLKNNEDDSLVVQFKKGQIFEVTSSNNSQNLILGQDFEVTIPPHQIVEFELPNHYCLNPNRNSPHDEEVIPTPLYFQPDRFNSQRDVWDYIKSLRDE